MRAALVSSADRDRRAVERMPTTLRGKVFPGELDCVIANFSKHGACLHFDARPALGDRVIHDGRRVRVYKSNGEMIDA